MKQTKKKLTWYVIFVGARPGVYTNWTLVKKYIEGYSKADYKKFHSKQEAEDAFEKCSRSTYNSDAAHVWNPPRPPRSK